MLGVQQHREPLPELGVTWYGSLWCATELILFLPSEAVCLLWLSLGSQIGSVGKEIFLASGNFLLFFYVAHSLEAKVFVALPVSLLRRKDKNMPKKILKEHQQAMILPDKKILLFFLSISYVVLLPHPLIFVF